MQLTVTPNSPKIQGAIKKNIRLKPHFNPIHTVKLKPG